MWTSTIAPEFVNKRLTATNIREYLQKVYGMGNEIKEVNRKQLSVPIFLQRNYGKDGDCTLTSILTLTKYYNKSLDTQTVYDYIEKIANKYLYNGDAYGTIPVFNKTITKQTFNHFGISKKISTRYFKDLGYNLQSIMDLLDNDTPVMISMFKDGRSYYDSHTITIIGYVQYRDEYDQTITMLMVHDNWFSSYSFLDYNPICAISEICYQ